MANQANNDSEPSFGDIFKAFTSKVKEKMTGSSITVPNPIGVMKDKVKQHNDAKPVSVQIAKDLVEQAESKLRTAKKAGRFWNSWDHQITEMEALASSVKDLHIDPAVAVEIAKVSADYRALYLAALADYNEVMSK